ncbi:MAG: M28 family peptidase [Bryobacteraceae bacterium]
MKRSILALLLCAAWVPAAEAPAFDYTPEIARALDRISAASLRGNLSFLASDQLEGRDTPSRGLDIAAEFIAAQFRRAGLEPAGDDGYFQTAQFAVRQAKPAAVQLDSAPVAAGEVAVLTPAALDLKDAPLVKSGEMEGKAALMEGGFSFRRLRDLRALRPAVIVIAASSAAAARRLAQPERLVDPSESPSAPVIAVHDERLATAKTISVRMEAPVDRSVKLRNVIGVLRGSDPKLRDTYVLLTAHYDHIGRKPGCTEGDCIYNGANDDGSGTVSVIEAANALAGLKPRRSVVFMTFFGEEKGGFGSRWYTRHPVFPLSATIGDVNLEQVGRTDSESGPQIGAATLTGFEFSDLPKAFEESGRRAGVKVESTPASDAYFGRSDNLMLAQAGIPAHTMCVAYSYPDYHGVGDEWEKIDFDNLARVNRMIALGVLMLADNPEAPRWNADNPKAQSYLNAWKQRHAE